MNVFSTIFFRRVLIALIAFSIAAGCDDRNSENNDSADASSATDVSNGHSDTGKDAHTGDTSVNNADGGLADARDGAEDESLCERIALGPNADLRGELLFPADSYWNQPVLDAEVDPNSAAIIASIGAERGMHADFGCCWPDSPFGIPYVVVDGSMPGAAMQFEYADESDPGPYPIPPNAPIEGGAAAEGDRHVLAIDCSSEKVYELFDAHPQSDGSWHAGSGAVWDLNKEPIRAPYCTSADAAGLPILPGLVRYDEVAAGEIRHALRFTVSQSRKAFVRPPASHWASNRTDENLAPMGMRVRLKSDAELGLDLSTFSEQSRIIIRAMQTYGMIVADNGSNWYISGAPSEKWDDSALSRDLKQIKGSHFEVLKMDGLVTDKSLLPGDCRLD